MTQNASSSRRDAGTNRVLPHYDHASPTDPTYALIEAHRAAYARWVEAAKGREAADTESPGGAEMTIAADEASRQEVAAYEALFAAQPATLAAASALAQHLAVVVEQVRIGAEVTDGERALRTVSAAMARLLGKRASGAPDPALAAIAASRLAEAEMAAFGDDGPTPLTPELRAREDVLCQAQRETREVAWATVPTTHEGRLALVDYARFQIEVHTGPDGRVDSAEDLFDEILGALEAAIRGERPEIDSAPSADPAGGDPSNLDALALVSAIEAEWEAQAQPGYDALPMVDDEAGYARRSALLSAADLLPADTRAARHAKALALAWIVYADLWQPGHTRDSYAADGRLALDIDGAFRTSITTEHPDAALLALGPTIAALITARDAVPADHEEAYARIDGLVLDEGRRLAAMRARTLAGLVLKARYVERGADEELKDAIVADLLALGGGE